MVIQTRIYGDSKNIPLYVGCINHIFKLLFFRYIPLHSHLSSEIRIDSVDSLAPYPIRRCPFRTVLKSNIKKMTPLSKMTMSTNTP